MHLLSTLLAVAAAALFVSPAHAQTTGVPSLNDLTINGSGSGSTSCTTITLSGPGATFTVTGDPGQAVFVLASLTPCTAPVACLPPVPCPIPFSACGAATNRSLDLVPPLLTACSFVLNAGGVGSCSVTVPPGILFSVQAAIVQSPTCGGNFVLTQAYNVVF